MGLPLSSSFGEFLVAFQPCCLLEGNRQWTDFSSLPQKERVCLREEMVAGRRRAGVGRWFIIAWKLESAIWNQLVSRLLCEHIHIMILFKAFTSLSEMLIVG